ncbi:MAG: hypothetical protein OXN95_05085 [bacterium]|nr:hypothetical protein [bacterium]
MDDDVGQPPWYGLVDLLDSEDRTTIGQEVEFDLLNPDWRDRLELADHQTHKRIAAEVISVANDRGIPRPQKATEDPALAALQEVLNSHQPQQLTPNQWHARASELIRGAESEPTLFLIDQRLGKGREGGSLVKDLLTKASEGCFFCILSAEVGIENEFDYWQKMCDDYGFTPGQVGIVAKEHLTGDQIGFARMLKISLTAGEVEDVRKGVLAATRLGFEAGLERFDELDLPTLTSIVFESSLVEGAWEVETILRVVRAFVDESLDNHVYGNPELADAVKTIAAAASVGTGTDERLDKAAFEIQFAERYVTGDYLSERRLAPANGDIFELAGENGGTSLWVLVAQPCDLAIRSDGKRGGSPTHLTILPIEHMKKAPRGSHVELLHYFQPSSDKAFVRLTKPAYVPTAILDLAAFSAGGEAVWARGADLEAMSVVGWEKRATKVSGQFERALRNYDQLDEESRHRMRALSLPAAQDPEISPNLDGDTVRYPIKRVGRLRERQAETVLQAYGLALSRTAEAHDLALISP